MRLSSMISAVDLHACGRLGARGLVVRGQQGLLERVDEDLEGDLLLAFQGAEEGKVDVHLSLLLSG